MKPSLLILTAAFIVGGSSHAVETKKETETSTKVEKESSVSAESEKSRDKSRVAENSEENMDEENVEEVNVDGTTDADASVTSDRSVEADTDASQESEVEVETQTSQTTVERADDDGRNLMRFGFQVGGNISNPRIQGAPSRTAEGGLWAGGILESRFLGKYINLQTELNYVQKPGHGTNDAVRLDYLEVPLHVKLKLDIADIRTFVQAGPSVGYLIRVQNGANRNFRNFDVDFSIGAGVAFHLSEKREKEFFIAGRYATGLRDIDDGTDEWKTEGVRVSAGMLF